MALYIAEKPSLARAIIDILPKPHQKGDGFIRAGNGDIVSWCIGHLLEQAPPDAYDPRYKKWKIEDLPIIPDTWKLIPKTSTAKQLKILTTLIKEASEINHVGDPDREGQLLIDEVLNYCQLPKEKRQQVRRCLINDLNPSAVSKALEHKRLNNEFASLSTSALARARADWLYGMNMSRICTLKGQAQGYQGVLSVGRVQTPLLGLVVRRDKEIESFIPKPFYEVYAIVETKKGDIFKAKWQPSEACSPYQDEEGRVLVKKLAENVIQRITGKEGVIEKVSKKQRELAPPLPLNLSSLQIEAARKLNLSAQQVLDVCQCLYEKHKLITYPRSDSRYLPKEHFFEAKGILSTIKLHCSNLAEHIEKSDLQLKSKAWDDSKVDAHHAIIPTLRKTDFSRLSINEKEIYQLISLFYIAQFYPAYRFLEQQIDVDIQGGKFIAKATQMTDVGWKTIFSHSAKEDEDDNKSSLLKFPLKKGEAVLCKEGELLERETQPPRPFNDATLLSAMTGIARFVKDPEIKKVLRQTDGLGTEATRAGIIELLFKRGFLERKGKQIRSTLAGQLLIESLPENATTPDMTALWESQLEEIYHKKSDYFTFMASLLDLLNSLLVKVNQSNFSKIREAGKILNSQVKFSSKSKRNKTKTG